ncbi:MAG: response regulator [Nitrosopumilaceae archaeon]|nr:response regulator [Nitrosopumilaceae archaeon]
MKLLIAEDEPDLLTQYKTILEESNHQVFAAEDGEIATKLYEAEFEKLISDDPTATPFDAVILDYQMPNKNGLDVAKDILNMCPKQRIIFASAYVQETLSDSIKNLKQIVELLQKPFGLQALIDTIEDKEIYQELEKLNVDIRNLKELNPSHAQIRDYLEALQKLQKGRTF